MKVGALDLGTNTFLLLIAQDDGRGGLLVEKDLSEIVRLGQEVDKTGEFHPEALKRARACLEKYAYEMKTAGVEKILAAATSAARDARNGEELFKMGEDLGIPIELISGEEEARISFDGATMDVMDASKSILVVDVGGGSTEFIRGRGGKIQLAQSLDIGAVRLTERCVKEQPVPEEQREQLRQEIDAALAPVIEALKGKYWPNEIRAVAGTPTALAAIELGGFDEKRVDGFHISRDKLREWTETFASTTIEEKKERYGLGGRADVIYAGTMILLRVLEGIGSPGFRVSTKGLRYGIALEILDRARTAAAAERARGE